MKNVSINSLEVTTKDRFFSRKTHSLFDLARYAVNSYADLNEVYSNFHQIESISIPLAQGSSYVTMPTSPSTSTARPTTSSTAQTSSYPWTIDYIHLHDYASIYNETRWLSSVEAYPDGRFLLIDNRNHQILLLNENGSYRIDLTSIYFHQMQYLSVNRTESSIPSSYSFSHLHIDEDSYVYLIPTIPYQIYIFSQENRLVRCLTPRYLALPIIRSECFAVTHTGLLYVCDDAHRSIRIYTRMGILQRIIRLNSLPLRLFISNTRLFSYSMENLGLIQIYSLTGVFIKSLTICSSSLPTEVIWFRGKYFLTCGIDLFVLDEQGEVIAEHHFHTLLEPVDRIVAIHDFALNKQGQILFTLRRNGTLFNRYWIVHPAMD